MSTEKLIIELDAKTSKLQAELTATDKRLKELEGQTKKNDKALNLFASASKAAAVGITAAATAMSAVIIASARSEQELSNLARTAKTTTDNFKSLAFAFEQYNVDAKGTADAMNDVSERLGEFQKAGTGAFQDFADVMNLTKKEAQVLAGELQYMSGEDVLIRMVGMMEEADKSGAEMSLTLKSMSNDLEYASQAFSNNGKVLKKLKGDYEGATSAMRLTSAESEIMRSTAESFSLATKTLGSSATLISSQLAPEFESFFNYVIGNVPSATQSIVNFLNSMKDPESITNIASIDEQIVAATGSIQNLLNERNKLESEKIAMPEQASGSQEVGLIQEQNEKTQESIDAVNKKLIEQQQLQKELGEQRASLFSQQEEQDKAEAESQDALIALQKEAKERKAEILADEQKAKEEALENRYKSEEELLLEKLNRELEIAAENDELKKQLELTYQEDLALLKQEKEAEADQISHELWLERLAERNQEKFDLEIQAQQDLLSQKLINEEEYLKQVNSIAIKYGKSQQKSDKETGKAQEATLESGLQTAITVNNALFENNKGLEAGLVVAKTGTAVMHQLESGDPYTAFARAAAAGAVGATQLASVLGASNSGGGGSISSVPSSSASSQPSEQPSVTGEVEINESIGSGGQASSTSNTVTITAEDGDELAEAFASVMNKKLNSGEITLG